MNRITRRFQDLRRAGRKALIPYITAGDPRPELTVPMLRALVDAGADILELGVPFSDPMADGPVIQKACERALAQGMSLRKVLDLVREFRRSDAETPLVLMGYLNPIERMGHAAFAAAARDAGVDGVLTVDLPPEEAAETVELLDKAGIAPIFLLAPTSSDQRIQHTARLARGYLYYVSLKGVTGSAALNVAEVAAKLDAGELDMEAAQLEIEKYWAGALRRAVIDGDVENGSLMAGQSVGMVTSEQPVAEIVAELMAQCEAALAG